MTRHGPLPTRFASAPVQRQAAMSRPATGVPPPPTRFAPVPAQRQAAMPRPATEVPPPPTRFAPAPVQRQAAVSRPATGAPPPPTRFAPAPILRQAAKSTSAMPAAAPHTRHSPPANGAIQLACFGWCFGGKQHQTLVPTQQGQSLKDRLADIADGAIAEGKASRVHNRAQEKRFIFGPSGMIET
jgi:hypothetical protein